MSLKNNIFKIKQTNKSGRTKTNNVDFMLFCVVFALYVLHRQKWLYKTEYFTAFPSFQIEMLECGYYLAHMKNITCWCPAEDTDARPRFCEFLKKEFGLADTCMPVGMRCGGMQTVCFAAKYPQYVSAVYLDAPVLNLLSCPCGAGAVSIPMGLTIILRL